MVIVESERLLREELRKRSTNSFKKINELAWMRDFNIYIPQVAFRHDDRYHTYKTTESN